MDRKTKRLVLALSMSVSVFVSPSEASDPSKDPGGWRQFKWGMSFDQVLKSSGGEVERSSGMSVVSQGRLENDVVAQATIVGSPVEVIFNFGCGDIGLIEVEIRSHVKPALDFRGLLIDQYGPNDKNIGSERDWLFPTTDIFSDTDVDYGNSVNYERRGWGFSKEDGEIDPEQQRLSYCKRHGFSTTKDNGL